MCAVEMMCMALADMQMEYLDGRSSFVNFARFLHILALKS